MLTDWIQCAVVDPRNDSATKRCVLIQRRVMCEMCPYLSSRHPVALAWQCAFCLVIPRVHGWSWLHHHDVYVMCDTTPTHVHTWVSGWT
eukprot:m.121154 g.121154  ORF g.121154 m.121154 type:complete len:89 (+) comp11075_c1_seq3:5038-5304(+)